MKNELKTLEQTGIMALDDWREGVGVSLVTTWRWRKLGYLKTTNIGGKHYVTSEAIAEFKRRADAGEFALEPRRPTAAKN